jgi:hypothetical protein
MKAIENEKNNTNDSAAKTAQMALARVNGNGMIARNRLRVAEVRREIPKVVRILSLFRMAASSASRIRGQGRPIGRRRQQSHRFHDAMITVRISSGSGSWRYSLAITSIGFLYMPLAISACRSERSIMTTFFAASIRSRTNGFWHADGRRLKVPVHDLYKLLAHHAVEAEFGMSRQTADNFVHVAEQFGSNRARESDLTPKALYALAALSAEPIREKVLELADKGEEIRAAKPIMRERRVCFLDATASLKWGAVCLTHEHCGAHAPKCHQPGSEKKVTWRNAQKIILKKNAFHDDTPRT